jgi:chemotaxis protein CheD
VIGNVNSLCTQVVVDLADMKTTNNPGGRLVTHDLGSCVAMAIFDPDARLGGLLRYMLPDSAINREKALLNPFFFADTGIPLLFRRLYKLGGEKGRIICKLAGASNIMGGENVFDIGSRNHLAARDILSKNNMPIHGEYVGEHEVLSLTLFMDTGRVMVTLPNGEEKTI